MNWFPLIVAIGWLTGCSTLDTITVDAQLNGVQRAELYGKGDFWPYANAGFKAGRDGDYETAKTMYLRAYRNTGITLPGPIPTGKRRPGLAMTMLFGQIPSLFDDDDADIYVQNLDALTPLPGVNPPPIDPHDYRTLYWRSLSSYNWALYAGRLGDFKGAEIGFLYSLNLERIRDPQNEDKYTSSRHFELGRLYSVWKKPHLAAEHFAQGFEKLDPRVKKFDPIGTAYVLDEYSVALSENGEFDKAKDISNQATELRRDNPKKKTRFKSMPFKIEG